MVLTLGLTLPPSPPCGGKCQTERLPSVTAARRPADVTPKYIERKGEREREREIEREREGERERERKRERERDPGLFTTPCSRWANFREETDSSRLLVAYISLSLYIYTYM